MLFVMKAICLAVYALAIASFAGLLPAGVFPHVKTIAIVLLILHLLELLFMFKHVKRYRGSLVMSVILTLLFGVLHWRPLARDAKRPGE